MLDRQEYRVYKVMTYAMEKISFSSRLFVLFCFSKWMSLRYLVMRLANIIITPCQQKNIITEVYPIENEVGTSINYEEGSRIPVFIFSPNLYSF